MTYLLRDMDNRNEPSAMITTETLTAKEVQDLIYEVKYRIDDDEYGDYDSEILTEILEEKGCTIKWIGGDDEVYW